MPKRPVTPEIDDGAKYLTVVEPYPLRPNMDLDKPRELFTQWITACIGPKYLRAFYYKPRSPGLIIVEVDEDLPDFSLLLGEHKWSQFLKNAQGQNTVSKMFYCTYKSDRIVQKNGWKRVDVREAWVRKPSKTFVVPYPQTAWCDIPIQSDVIQNELCRPLPQQDFPPPPPPAPAPVVGTPEWQEWKRRQDSTKPVRAWTRDGPTVMITPASARQAWTSGATNSLSPNFPPGLTRGGSSASTTSRGSDTQPLSPVDDDGPQVGIASEHLEHALEGLALGDQNGFDDDDMYQAHTIVESDSLVGELQHGKYTILPEDKPVQSLWDDYVPSDDDGDDDDDDDDEGIKRGAAKNPELCKVHNKICKKGICKVYANQLRQTRERERKEQLRKEREAAQAKREKKKTQSATSSSTASGASTHVPPSHLRPGAAPRQLPPHLQRGAAATAVPKASPRAAGGDDHRDSDDDGDGRDTPTPSDHQQDDETCSVSSVGWGVASDSPDGPVYRPKANNWGMPTSKPPPRDPASGPNANASAPKPEAPKAWGAWGKAPSISASSIKRNQDGWSVSAPPPDDDDWPSVADGPTSGNVKPAANSAPPAAQGQKAWGAWGKAPSISASSVRRNNDAWSTSGRSVSNGGDARSVAASEAVGWSKDGPWGSTDAVKAARRGGGGGGGGWSRAGGSSKAGGKKKAWADQVEEEMEFNDARSVAASTDSGQTWGNVSAGPW